MGLRIARRAWIKWMNPKIFHPQNFGKVTCGSIPTMEHVTRAGLSSSQLKPQQFRLYSTEARSPQLEEGLGKNSKLYEMAFNYN